MINLKLNTLMVMLICLILSVAVTGVLEAAPLDLTTHDASGYINEALFVQLNLEHSTGTGVIQPFLRIQKNGIEEGYNTAFSPIEFPDANSSWTKALLLVDVPVVNVNGVIYREFFLDINESGGGNQLLSLDKLQIFLGDSPDLTNYPTGLGTLIWDMDAGIEGDTWVKLDASLESGSGNGDMLVYIPNSLFVGGPYVYLYSMFGAEGTKTNGLGSSDGFEEWAVRSGTVIPEPSSILAFGTGLIGMVGLATRKYRK